MSGYQMSVPMAVTTKSAYIYLLKPNTCNSLNLEPLNRTKLIRDASFIFNELTTHK